MQTDNTYFEQLNSALTVQSISSRLQEGFPCEYLQVDSVEAWRDFVGYEPEEPFPLLDSNENPIGFVWARDKSADTTLYETMEKIEPNDFLTSNTSVLDAIQLFSDPEIDHFYILDGNTVSGILLFSDFYGPLGRLTFLALALEIEERAIRICQLRELRERCWAELPSKRKDKAYELYEKRHGKEVDRTSPEKLPLKELIDCTHFCDKATMIWKCKLLSNKSKKKFNSIFHKLEKIRNSCAHSKSNNELMEFLPREKLIEFLFSAKELRDDLKKCWSEKILEFF